jgi:hypothetical protein
MIIIVVIIEAELTDANEIRKKKKKDEEKILK